MALPGIGSVHPESWTAEGGREEGRRPPTDTPCRTVLPPARGESPPPPTVVERKTTVWLLRPVFLGMGGGEKVVVPREQGRAADGPGRRQRKMPLGRDCPRPLQQQPLASFPFRPGR